MQGKEQAAMATTGAFPLLILAAGSSSRLGEPKQLLEFEGESLLRRAAQVALSSRCDPVSVILGSGWRRLRKSIDDLNLSVVVNPGWKEGISSSIRAGLESVDWGRTDSVVIATCDQPFVTPRLLDEMVRIRLESDVRVVACRYAGTFGVPALFAIELRAELEVLAGDQGAKAVISRHAGEATFLDFPEGEVDIDTRADYRELTIGKA